MLKKLHKNTQTCYNKENEFYEINIVIPFCMAYGLLRIAMFKFNTNYRDYPLREAENFLEVLEKI